MKSKTICVKCGKGIRCSSGYYNYPSGPMHTKCGKEKAEKLKAIQDKYGLLIGIWSA